MTILVADIGGTNARLACASDDGLDSTTIRHFRNADYSSFEEVIATYLASEQVGPILSCCVAMAEPVSAGRGVITNRGWGISVDKLKAATRSDQAILLNDLTALGYTVGHLPEGGVSKICGTTTSAPARGQSLIVGIGTGFNTCPVIATADDTLCLEAEAGHTSLPVSVFHELKRMLGPNAHEFPTVEHCFSGRGLSRMFQLTSDRDGLSAGDIVAASHKANDAKATQFLKLYSKMLGHLCRELVLQYLPRNGVLFAGSVARGIFHSGFGDEFAAAFNQFEKFEHELSTVPIYLIENDCAALIGCTRAANLISRLH